MNQAKKINNLIDQLGLKQRRVAQKIGVHFTTMSRKAKDGSRYDAETLEKISAELGLTVQYLQDDLRPYEVGSPIPPDALLPATKPADTSDGDAIAALMQLAEKQMRHREAVDSRIEPPPGASEEVVGILSGILEEMKLMRADVNRLLESAAMPGGEHDPD